VNYLCSATPHDEENLREIIATVPGVIYQFIIRPEGRREFSFLSEGIKELFGIGSEEVYRDIRAISSRVHPGDKRDYRDSIFTAAKNVCAWYSEFRIITPDGMEKWVQGIAKPQRLSNGVTLWNGVLLDITTRKKLEAELKYLSTHDQLTGLYNRSYFENEIVRRGTMTASNTAIIVCDIDGLMILLASRKGIDC
jgi:PAS domain S-box-containing protein